MCGFWHAGLRRGGNSSHLCAVSSCPRMAIFISWCESSEGTATQGMISIKSFAQPPFVTVGFPKSWEDKVAGRDTLDVTCLDPVWNLTVPHTSLT